MRRATSPRPPRGAHPASPRLLNRSDVLIGRRPGAEDGGANAHISRAELNGTREVPAHPHAELPKPKPLGDLGEQREMHCWLLVERRDAHRALDCQSERVAAERAKGVRLGGEPARRFRARPRVYLTC